MCRIFAFIRSVSFISFAEKFVLVYWPDEESTSVVHQTAILAPPIANQTIGCVCTVKVGGTKCDGRIAGIGKLIVHVCVQQNSV